MKTKGTKEEKAENLSKAYNLAQDIEYHLTKGVNGLHDLLSNDAMTQGDRVLLQDEVWRKVQDALSVIENFQEDIHNRELRARGEEVEAQKEAES